LIALLVRTKPEMWVDLCPYRLIRAQERAPGQETPTAQPFAGLGGVLSARADVLTTGLSLTPNACRELPSFYVTEAEPAVPRSKLARECALRFSQLVKSHREQKSSAIEDMTKT
jgi:hypothetical protein